MEPTQIGLKVEAKVRTTPEINKLFLPGELGAVLDWQVRDTKTGELISEGIKKSKSFLRQFIDLLIVKFNNIYFANAVQIRDTSNNLREISNTPACFNTDAAIGDVTMGIIVGTGTTAPTINDYAIQTLIPHDTGGHPAGSMQYGAMTYGAPASDSTTSQFTLTRNFANATGAAITVNEIGLYVKAHLGFAFKGSGGFINCFFMTLRDVIAGGIVVGAGQTLTVNYRPQCVI